MRMYCWSLGLRVAPIAGSPVRYISTPHRKAHARMVAPRSVLGTARRTRREMSGVGHRRSRQ
eukprot:3357012-Rhodomonas_salina.2